MSLDRPGRLFVFCCFGLWLPAMTGCDAICALLNLPTDVCANIRTQQTPLQDLQVTVEVRFIGVSDNFFERIGVDFDFEIDQEANVEAAGDPSTASNDDATSAFLAASSLVGGPANTTMFSPRMANELSLLLPTVPNDQSGADVNAFPFLLRPDYNIAQTRTDLPGSFDDVNGGAFLSEKWDDVDVASIGFAILSDLQASFFLQAARDDSDNGVLEAPKVTLFNGQSAVVISKNEMAPVADLEPAFGTIVNDIDVSALTVQSGPTLKIEPVISPDRSTIHLTIQPIRAVQLPYPDRVTSDGKDSIIEFPVIQTSSVQTMVSVPDGGTILLGGMKRMSDGGEERGVPILNKLPYINRLFRNTGTIKDSQSLLIMVTPRIIIQEEEEE